MPGKKANIFKARYLYGRHGRICGGMGRQKSAEAMVVDERLNLSKEAGLIFCLP